MWLFFPFAFISVVHKPGDPLDLLCVRARDALSLDNVRARCPSLGPTITGSGTDYPFRAYVNAADFGAFVGAYAASINFSNFTAETTRQHGLNYHDACMSVWGVMHRVSPGRTPAGGGWRGNAGMPDDDFFGPPRGGYPLALLETMLPVLPAPPVRRRKRNRRHR
jgi:hypothetical protein